MNRLVDTIKNMARQELERRINAMENSIEQCSSINDLHYLNLLYNEAGKRGYVVKTQTVIILETPETEEVIEI